MCVSGREKERKSDGETERETKREKERKRDGEIERDREIERRKIYS